MNEKEMIIQVLKRLKIEYQEYGNFNIELLGRNVQINFDFNENGQITDIYYYSDYE